MLKYRLDLNLLYFILINTNVFLEFHTFLTNFKLISNIQFDQQYSPFKFLYKIMKIFFFRLEREDNRLFIYD